MSSASIPGSSAEILYTLSSSLMSIAGTEKLNEFAERHKGSMSKTRRSAGKPNRSNSRSISPRKDCHMSGVVVCARGAFFNSTGTSDIDVSVFRQPGIESSPARTKCASLPDETLIQRNPSGDEEEK